MCNIDTHKLVQMYVVICGPVHLHTLSPGYSCEMELEASNHNVTQGTAVDPNPYSE